MAEAIARATARQTALLALPLLDLGDLHKNADEASARTLCARARTSGGPVAAVCLDAAFIGLAKQLLAYSSIRIATTADAPESITDPGAAADRIAAAVAAGADEVDIVLPDPATLAGDAQARKDLVRRCRAACRRPTGGPALLKVILESGRLGDAAAVRRAASEVIDAGADFVKTSTGRLEPGATIAAATAILQAIAAARRHRIWAGLAVSGGIDTLSEAIAYMALAERLIGRDFVGPATFRIGGSLLLDDILAALGSGR